MGLSRKLIYVTCNSITIGKRFCSKYKINSWNCGAGYRSEVTVGVKVNTNTQKAFVVTRLPSASVEVYKKSQGSS